jgi:hypothetical protein
MRGIVDEIRIALAPNSPASIAWKNLLRIRASDDHVAAYPAAMK